jgi:hypothetical protein
MPARGHDVQIEIGPTLPGEADTEKAFADAGLFEASRADGAVVFFVALLARLLGAFFEEAVALYTVSIATQPE